ncbi:MULTISPECIES: DUF4318 domain-containing protein [unclassified Paenibacillus]|uniref:DUF4318 domain-containing protein n=1 Tax=unclassified Paenibacillus TaxID=185978 RepID=UPI001EF4AFE6|nr:MULTISPECIES: DUF4318 domain-containing protein [unclassified Paenibacillus]
MRVGAMMKDLVKKLLKKGFTVELEKVPANKQEFLDEIERYCKKEQVTYEFVEYTMPAVVSLDNVVYTCDVENAGRIGFVLHFKEI